jgi:hypothetical protein
MEHLLVSIIKELHCLCFILLCAVQSVTVVGKAFSPISCHLLLQIFCISKTFEMLCYVPNEE